jgi:hypothetical protein
MLAAAIAAFVVVVLIIALSGMGAVFPVVVVVTATLSLIAIQRTLALRGAPRVRRPPMRARGARQASSARAEIRAPFERTTAALRGALAARVSSTRRALGRAVEERYRRDVTSDAQHSSADTAVSQIAECKLDLAGLDGQHERYRALSAAATAVVRAPQRLEVRFSSAIDEQLLEQALSVERECCPFFELEYRSDARALSVSVADAAHDPALDALADAFRFDARAAGKRAAAGQPATAAARAQMAAARDGASE